MVPLRGTAHFFPPPCLENGRAFASAFSECQSDPLSLLLGLTVDTETRRGRGRSVIIGFSSRTVTHGELNTDGRLEVFK